MKGFVKDGVKKWAGAQKEFWISPLYLLPISAQSAVLFLPVQAKKTYDNSKQWKTYLHLLKSSLFLQWPPNAKNEVYYIFAGRTLRLSEASKAQFESCMMQQIWHPI